MSTSLHHSATDDAPPDHPAAGDFALLKHAINHATHLLPTQGPITVFVHHNTFHALEDLPFEDALRRGGAVYGCHTYLPEEQYRHALAHGRIRVEDLIAELQQDPETEADRLLGYMGTLYGLRLAMLEFPLRIATDEELRWLMVETDSLRRFRPEATPAVRERVVSQTRHWVMRDLRNGPQHPADDAQRRIKAMLHDLYEHFDKDAIETWSDETWESFCLNVLWRVCRQGVHGLPAADHPRYALVRHRDMLLEATGEDSDRLVHDLLIRFCGAFLDQGVAVWPLPDRDAGFLRAFARLYRRRLGPPDRWLRGLRKELDKLLACESGPLASIDESLELLGVAEPEREEFLTQTLLALRGWAGMIWQMETNAEWTIRPAPSGSLLEFLAVRLLLDRLAVADVARRTLGYRGPLRELRTAIPAQPGRPPGGSVDQRAFAVFQLAQVRGWKPEDLFRMSKREWGQLVGEIEGFSGAERRRIYQRAFERRFRRQALSAFSAHAERRWAPADTPKFQLITCIDDREESFRRHLEEIIPECETFGVAGFFAAAMYYRGAADAHFIPLCPIVIKPKHYVQEEVAYTFEGDHVRRARTRRALGTASHWFHTGSRSFLGGAVTAMVGSLASIPLVARILFPRSTAQIRRLFGSFVQPPPITQLRLERTEPLPGPRNGQLGFSIDEMTANVARMLQDIGLTGRFSRLVIVVGHGSSSLNNPHESAYNCGACGGGRGGPNARAFAMMANDPRVRERLARDGLRLPADTHFVGAYHNTCDDSVTYFDLDRLPVTHRPVFDEAKRSIDRARERNAHERCRRFESAPLSLSAEAALRHVEERAEDLSQARPEYNHATNAICFVGRRARTRGLFLDRRSFLASYDPTQDDGEQSVLARILAAVIPVCAGISLEYYFSTVDVATLGCGSKLPHNIASLLGVMEGAASDLRTGLSAQMTEIHEAVRLLFVIETTPEAMLRIIERNPVVGVLCRNDWVCIATLDPHSNRVQVLRDGRFEPFEPEAEELPEVDRSLDWYRGWRDHLRFAVVRGGRPPGHAAASIRKEAAE